MPPPDVTPPVAPAPPVTMVDPSGRAYAVPADQVAGYLSQGFTVEGGGEHADRLVKESDEEQYGGAGNALAAGVESGLGTVTLGATDALVAGLGGSDALRKLHEAHPIASTIGGVAGAFVPTGAASLAGKVGKAIRAGEEAGVVAKLGRGALAGATEGAIYGGGAAVSQLAMDRDPLTMEHASSVLGSNLLFGGAVGGAAGLAGSALERVLGAGQRAVDRKLAAGATDAAGADAIAAEPDLATLDLKGLKDAHAAELADLEAARVPERKAFVDDLKAAREANTLAEPWKVVERSPNKFTREAGAAAVGADMKLRGVLDNLESLAAKPERALDALQRQSQAYETLLDAAKSDALAYEREFQDAPRKIANDLMDSSKNWEQSAGFQVPKGTVKPVQLVGKTSLTEDGLQNWVDKEMARRYGTGPEPVFPERLKLIPEVEATLQRNQAMRERLAAITAEPSSDRLTAIQDALESAKAPHPKSLGERLIGALPGGHTFNELSSLGRDVLGSLRTATGKAARKSGEVVSAIINGTRQVVERATPVATKELSEVSFGPASSHRIAESAVPGARRDLPALFADRTDEIKAQTAYDATGIPRIRPEARAAIAKRLQPIAAHDPTIADRLETLAVRRLEYLSSIIPRRPDMGGILTGGPDTWKPSDMEMRAWARAVTAIEDPHGVEQRILAGTLTPEDVSAYWAVYPERGRDFQQQVLTELPKRTKPLPYAQRLTLGMFTGQPIDPSMNPKVLGYLQDQFAGEPGSDGGTAAPKPQPQFGSIKKSPDAPTPAQNRAQGAHA